MRYYINHHLYAFTGDEYSPTAMRDWINALAVVLHYNFSGERGWHAREQRSYPMHEAVFKAVDLVRPDDWHQLVLEWPHVSTTDPHRLSYTRDDRAGRDNKQTITTIGRYLSRHFSKLADHQIRDIAALYSATGCEVVNTMDEILDTLQRGPQSCMRWTDCSVPYHPYRVYDPAYGWGMARRIINGDVIGRALVYESDDHKCYVRSYRKTDGYSPSDEILEAWLKDQGYVHEASWPQGARLAYIEGRHSMFTAPYLDGEDQRVSIGRKASGGAYLFIDPDGEYTCNNTDGTPEMEDETEECADCGDYNHPEDMYWVDNYEDRHVCSGCHDNYIESYTRGGRLRMIHQDNVIYVESCDSHYDVDYLSDNGIVELANGDYEHTDNTWWCEHSDAYYSDDETAVVVKDAQGNDMLVHEDFADQYDNDENEGE